jgi:hypothetical protein
LPDAALEATERQFIRLVGGCNRIAQFFVYPFSLSGLPRGKETQEYIERYYSTFEDLQKSGLDALIITGANVVNPSLESEPFWDPLMEVISWAQEGHQLGTGKCRFDPVFLPGHPRCAQALSWHRASAASGKAMGCLQSQDRPAGTSPVTGNKYPV